MQIVRCRIIVRLKYLRNGDKGILLGILLAAMLYFVWQAFPSSGQETVLLEIKGPWQETISLPVDQIATDREREWSIDGPAGGLSLVFQPGSGFAVRDVSCPDRVCANTGYILRAGQSIVCVPNEIIIRLTGADREGGAALDGVLR